MIYQLPSCGNELVGLGNALARSRAAALARCPRTTRNERGIHSIIPWWSKSERRRRRFSLSVSRALCRKRAMPWQSQCNRYFGSSVSLSIRDALRKKRHKKVPRRQTLSATAGTQKITARAARDERSFGSGKTFFGGKKLFVGTN